MLTLYKSMVRSLLEYCCPSWNPFKVSDIQELEGVQRTFTSQIAETQHFDYWGRERYILLHMWKILHGSISSDMKINFISLQDLELALKQLSPPYEWVLLLTTRTSMTIRSLLLAHVSETVFLVTSTGWKNLNPSKYNSHPCSGRSLTSLRSRDIHPLIPTPSWNGERIL